MIPLRLPAKRAKRNRPEQKLQIAVMRYLDLALPKDAIAIHVPNGGKRTKAEAGIFKAMGVKAGVPDIIIFCRGRTLCIELKAGRGRESWAQHQMRQRFSYLGILVATARSLEDVEYILTNERIPLRALTESPALKTGRE